MLNHARSWLLASSALMLACGGSNPAPAPDAYLEPDAAVPCPTAAQAQTLVGQHLRQQTAGDPAAGRSSCRLYRADVSFEAFDEQTCTLTGLFGWSGVDDAGVTSAGAHGFACMLGGAEGITCAGETIGTAGTALVSMSVSVPQSGATTITMRTDEESCVDEAEPVP